MHHTHELHVRASITKHKHRRPLPPKRLLACYVWRPIHIHAWHHSSCKLRKLCMATEVPPDVCVFCCSRPALILAMRRMRSMAAIRLHPAMLSRIKIGNRNNADTASCVGCDAPQMDSFRGCAPTVPSDLHAPHQWFPCNRRIPFNFLGLYRIQIPGNQETAGSTAPHSAEDACPREDNQL